MMDPRRLKRSSPQSEFRWTGFATALTGLILVLAACSGLDPTPEPDPIDPNSPCGTGPAVFNAFPTGFGPVGTDTTLEIATWNIQNFPKAGTGTIDRVVEIVNTLRIDLYGLEEIEDTTQYRVLLNRLPDHAGVYSPDVYGFGNYQKTGFLYNKSVLTMNYRRVPPEFLGNSFAFPRPPLEADFTARGNGHEYHFRAIVMHLKAGKDNADDQARRVAATTILNNYLEARALAEPGIDYVLLGDWNDVLTDTPMELNTFRDFLADPSNFLFLSKSLTSRSDMSSHPIGLIDHIMVNRSACPEFSAGRIGTLRLDLLVTGYTSFVSDHRPVVAVYRAF